MFLSEKDMEYLKSVSERFVNYSGFELEDFTHDLPEWENPHGSNKKIRFQDIMRALGKSEDAIKQSKQEYEYISNIQTALV